MEKQPHPRISLWKEDALAALIWLLWAIGAPLFFLSLDRVAS